MVYRSNKGQRRKRSKKPGQNFNTWKEAEIKWDCKVEKRKWRTGRRKAGGERERERDMKVKMSINLILIIILNNKRRKHLRTISKTIYYSA